MDQPIVLKGDFEDKKKRADFHALFKTKIPEFISDTIVDDQNKAGQSRVMRIYCAAGLSGRARRKLNLNERAKPHIP